VLAAVPGTRPIIANLRTMIGCFSNRGARGRQLPRGLRDIDVPVDRRADIPAADLCQRERVVTAWELTGVLERQR
jgi:hypothetical protein